MDSPQSRPNATEITKFESLIYSQRESKEETPG